MKKTLIAMAGAAAVSFSATAQAQSIGPLDHVFLIIMENQTNTDILNNPHAPFINAYAKVANQATNYYAVGHPSAPNYLELVGGSNFNVTNDYWPNWIHGGCVDHAPQSTGCVNAVTPIAKAGLDNPVVATAVNASQCNGQISLSGTPVPHNCALYNYSAKVFTPKSIADQLVEAHKTWATYQESLPIFYPPRVDGINYSDGAFSNLSPVADFAPGPIQKLYAVKHNPFTYFQDLQLGTNPELSYNQILDFDNSNGLWSNLQSPNKMPNFAFIVPNQCHDMHGSVSGGPPICSTSTPEEAQLLIAEGDAEVKKLVNGIKTSPVWAKGRNVIIVTWDENDYSNAANKVILLVETNYAQNGRTSNVPYDHYSLLKTIEAGFGLPCLNHACDSTSLIMSDLF